MWFNHKARVRWGRGLALSLGRFGGVIFAVQRHSEVHILVTCCESNARNAFKPQH